MTPYKHLIYLAQSHWTFWCVGSSEYSPSLLSWVQFFFSFSFIFFNMNCSSGTSAQEDGLLFHRKDKGCVHLRFVTGFRDHWEGRDVSDPWILRFFFCPIKLCCLWKGSNVIWTWEQNWLKKRIRGKRRGETNNVFPSFALSSKRLENNNNNNNLALERK